MAEVQQILVEFVVDDTGLKPAEDRLEALGVIDKKTAAAFKATNAELQKRQQAMNATAKASQQSAAATKKSIDDVDKAVKTFTQDFVEGFQEGVQAELKAAGVSAEEFAAALKTGQTEVSKSSETLKSRLREITEQLAVMKNAGKENTLEYKSLVKEAGNLNDALQDVRQEIRNAGSDTAVFDGLISAAQGVTGAFAVGQGAIGLFGDESEELQETLLKVNSAMAILQGLQQVQNVLQKESAAATLLTNVQRKIQNAQLVIENALQSQSIVVRGGAAVAQKLLNAAMAANPIGIVAVALAGLITLLATYGRSASIARQQTSSLNVALSSGAENFREREDAIRKSGESIINSLENEGAVGSKIAKQEIENQRQVVQARKERLKELETLLKNSPDADLEKRQELSKEIRRLQDQDINDRIEGNNLVARLSIEQRREELQGIADLAEARLAGTVKNSKAELDAAKASAIARAEVEINAAGQNSQEIVRINAELRKKLDDLDRGYAQKRQERAIDNIETELARASERSRQINDRQSEEELQLENKLILQKARLQILQEGLTQEEKNNIIERALLEIQRKEREFRNQSAIETLEDLNSRREAELAKVDLTNKERLNLTIESIITTASIEIAQNKGKIDKIKAIEAKRDADIRAARLASIEKEVEDEITLRASKSGKDIRAEDRLLAAQDAFRNIYSKKEIDRISKETGARKLNLQEQLEIIDRQTKREQSDIVLRIDALNKERDQKLLSQKEYEKKYEDLVDQSAQITEKGEERKRKAQEDTENDTRERQKRIRDIIIEQAQIAYNLLQELSQVQSERELQRIDEQKERIAELRESGAITEKEEKQRLKRLEQEERNIRRRQAQREKAFAIFNTIVATAQAVVKALAVGPPQGFILAAITAALGAAQIALIAARPIPAFRKGKKDSYQGPGIVGEAGAELIEKDGQLFVAPKKTIVWLGAKDKVFNPQETASMLEKNGLKAQNIEHLYNHQSTSSVQIDYDKLGKAVGKNIPQFGLNVDSQGFTEWVRHAQSFEKYLNSRRGYK